jgi:hypothetical protein
MKAMLISDICVSPKSEDRLVTCQGSGITDGRAKKYALTIDRIISID